MRDFYFVDFCFYLFPSIFGGVVCGSQLLELGTGSLVLNPSPCLTHAFGTMTLLLTTALAAVLHFLKVVFSFSLSLKHFLTSIAPFSARGSSGRAWGI